jgi:hypothetical protein
MGQEYNEKMFFVHTSSILHGELVGAGSLGPGFALRYKILVQRFGSPL